MASRVIYSAPILLLHFILFFSNRIVAVETQEILLYSTPGSQGSRLTTYIIHVEAPPPHVGADPEGREAWHRSFLPVHLLDSGEQRLLYSYEHVITGFAARLTEEELAVVREMDGFLAAYPDELIPLQTTHSPEYLRLQTSGVWNDSNYGEGVIIGVLDTGINPDHPSFGCDLPPPPSTWKGQCEFGPNRCSTKIIDFSGDGTVRHRGHGTHVASTAAGCFVDAAASYGQAQGTAVGVAPRAYISVYKVCGSNGCPNSDILAGLDAAISDGIHVASLSLGGPSSTASTLIPLPSAASRRWRRASSSAAPRETMGRASARRYRLGNGLEFDGESLYQPSFPSTQRPLVAGGVSVLNAGGAAMILANTAREGTPPLRSPTSFRCPTSALTSIGDKTVHKSGSNPTATIVFKGTSPEGSSLRRWRTFLEGAQHLQPGILKPDIVAPGVNILAAWPTPVGTPDAQSSFFVISGTSMATPHVSGVAALAKAAHPTWSPGAIKSSLMTSASQVGNAGKRIEDHVGNPASRFDIGAGEVDARGPLTPAWSTKVSSSDYIAYLCGLGYTNRQIRIIAGRRREVTRHADQLGASGDDLHSPESGIRPGVGDRPTGHSHILLREKKQYTVTFARSGSGRGSPSAACWVGLAMA
ncbi:unnamed protein product [Spirodela intermedia]|uniref:Uncharacterized protein n=1 Tax=Spirodela intermedia TaxID=51605 RepID=A0A7I8JHA9_SPIIN|nr:unnamed protein product [Spirodela intermedia]CAA6669518.1 unnamed protein product [Spirodela intermedia]